MDDNKGIYECEHSPTLHPKRRSSDMGVLTVDEVHQMIIEATKEHVEAQKTFTKEVEVLASKIAKYNGLWEHQEKQDKKLESFSHKMDTTLAAMTKSITTLSETQMLCMTKSAERTRTIESLRTWGGWMFGLTSTLLAIILALRSLLGAM